MISRPQSILFGPGGRIGRTSFALGVVMLVALALLANTLLRVLDSDTLWHFLFGFFFYLTFLYMLASVYVQRLHDLGRSAWVFTSWVSLIILTLIAVMLAYGGVEYFNAFSQFDRKEVIDPEITQALQADYRRELERGGPTLRLILSVLIGGFTLALALWPGQSGENAYGDPPVGTAPRASA